MDEPALHLSGVTLTRRGSVVLDQIDLTVAKGEFVGVIGPNGGGKSMLLACILGLEQPDAGSLTVFGMSPKQARPLVGWVPQFARFDPDFPIRVADVVACGLLACEHPRAQHQALVDEALQRVGLAPLAARQVGSLSGGEVQRVLIARALVARPRLLLLDEPGASLDGPQSATLHELLAELAGERTILLVSHDVAVVSRHVDSIACLNRRLVHHGAKELSRETVEEVYGCPVDFVVHAHTHVVLPDHDGADCGHDHDHGPQDAPS
ncbi:MAG: ABC transporter [Planctomycetota bacterium]|nr:MAG: ABC transporter [Planctomycetota bacterium]